MSPRVGLVIVTYQAEAFVRRTLDSIAAQSRPPDRVVVVDNASRDGTVAAVQDATRGWTLPLQLIVEPSNTGFAAANNRAVRELADCELVALVNPDAFPEPAWLALLVEAASEWPDCGSFASRLMVDGTSDRVDGAGDVCHVSGLVWRHGHGLPLADVAGVLEPRPVFSACAAAALYRRDDWNRVGGFDERFFCYVEDVDLGFRLQLVERGCLYVPGAVARHVGSASAGVGSRFAVYHGHRNLERLYIKNMPAGLFWSGLPRHLLVGAAGLLRFGRQGLAGPYLRAKWDALCGVPAAFAARRTVQAGRTASTSAIRRLLDVSSLRARWRQGPGGER